MREQLINALSYPRFLIRTELPLESCHHDGHYTDTDERCVKCEFQSECNWLDQQDYDKVLESKSERDLLGALAYALNFVDAITGSWDHPVRGCQCEACQWLRQAEKLYVCVSESLRPQRSARMDSLR